MTRNLILHGYRNTQFPNFTIPPLWLSYPITWKYCYPCYSFLALQFQNLNPPHAFFWIIIIIPLIFYIYFSFILFLYYFLLFFLLDKSRTSVLIVITILLITLLCWCYAILFSFEILCLWVMVSTKSLFQVCPSPPSPPTTLSPGMFVVSEKILCQPSFDLIRLLRKIIHFQRKKIFFFQLITCFST